MKINHIGKDFSILHRFLEEIRDVEVQKDRMRFRRNIERIGEILAYEMSQALDYQKKDVTTPLGVKAVGTMRDEVVICSVLRAGLPLHAGILNYFDAAQNAFISAYRHHLSETEFEILVEYQACPSLDGKILILADPMLATGRSFVLTLQALQTLGTPKEIHLLSVIGARQGINYVNDNVPENTWLWIGDIDEELNEKGYIVPGLGDAGDLAFGNKLQH